MSLGKPPASQICVTMQPPKSLLKTHALGLASLGGIVSANCSLDSETSLKSTQCWPWNLVHKSTYPSTFVPVHKIHAQPNDRQHPNSLNHDSVKPHFRHTIPNSCSSSKVLLPSADKTEAAQWPREAPSQASRYSSTTKGQTVRQQRDETSTKVRQRRDKRYINKRAKGPPTKRQKDGAGGNPPTKRWGGGVGGGPSTKGVKSTNEGGGGGGSPTGLMSSSTMKGQSGNL